MIYKIPPGGGGKPYLAIGLIYFAWLSPQSFCEMSFLVTHILQAPYMVYYFISLAVTDGLWSVIMAFSDNIFTYFGFHF